MRPCPPELVVLAAAQDDVLTRRQLEEADVGQSVISRRVRSGVWSSPVRGTVLVHPLRDEFRSRVRAAVLVSGGVVAYETAARLHGMQGLPPWTSAEVPRVVVGPHQTRAQRRGCRQHFRRLPPSEVVEVAGFRATSPSRTLLDLATGLDELTLLALVDSALHAGLLTSLPDALPVNVRQMADGRAESPAETLARWRTVIVGIPPEALQFDVYDGRDFIARLDLAWPSRRVALEVDSRHHDEPQALYRDRDRQNRLLNLGWTVLRTTWSDLKTNPVATLAALFRALGVSGPLKISR